jgi:SAM-dependent methyltransferase
MRCLRSLKKHVITMTLLALAAGASVEAKQDQPRIRFPDIIAMMERLNQFAETLPDSEKLGIGEVIAYEENADFVYILGRTPSYVRRLFFVKPSTLIVSDVLKHASEKPTWSISMEGTPRIDGRRITIGEGASFCETVLPAEIDVGSVKADRGTTVEVAAKKNHERIFVNVIYIGGSDKAAPPEVKLIGAGHVPQLNVTVGDAKFDIVLPPEERLAGTVALSRPDKKKSFERRLLPSGILPHGKKAVAMLNRWDNAYRHNRLPGWDTGRVAPELRRAVESGTVMPGRVVILGCGTGTNAEYLAGKGFEVTAIDIAPTCLVYAKAKSDRTGSGVRWMFADVLATPDMTPFDFIFDRGCYHNVRKHNGPAFIKATRKLSRPGTQFLLLAGNANEKKHWGPPRVKEEEIRKDFSPSFDFVWMKTTKFDLGRKGPGTKGPLAWSVLMKRKMN